MQLQYYIPTRVSENVVTGNPLHDDFIKQWNAEKQEFVKWFGKIVHDAQLMAKEERTVLANIYDFSSDMDYDEIVVKNEFMVLDKDQGKMEFIKQLRNVQIHGLDGRLVYDNIWRVIFEYYRCHIMTSNDRLSVSTNEGINWGGGPNRFNEYTVFFEDDRQDIVSGFVVAHDVGRYEEFWMKIRLGWPDCNQWGKDKHCIVTVGLVPVHMIGTDTNDIHEMIKLAEAESNNTRLLQFRMSNERDVKVLHNDWEMLEKRLEMDGFEFTLEQGDWEDAMLYSTFLNCANHEEQSGEWKYDKSIQERYYFYITTRYCSFQRIVVTLKSKSPPVPKLNVKEIMGKYLRSQGESNVTGWMDKNCPWLN